MIEFEAFTEGLAKIGVAMLQPYDAVALAAFHDVLGSQTDADEWPRFVAWALAVGRWSTYRPKVPDIQEALRKFRGQRPLLVEATDAYERVLASGTYTPEGGTSWDYRSIREACGEGAALAFLAAGGNAGFSTTWDEAKRRERFAAAYAEAVREEPTAGLLPPGDAPKLLPSGGEAPPTREEAGTVIRRLRDLAGVEPEPPKSTVVVASDQRLEELRRQAREIGRATAVAVEEIEGRG